MSIQLPIPGTVLQPGTPWLAGTRFLPEPRLPQDDDRPVPPPRQTGRLAQVLSALSRS